MCISQINAAPVANSNDAPPVLPNRIFRRSQSGMAHPCLAHSLIGSRISRPVTAPTGARPAAGTLPAPHEPADAGQRQTPRYSTLDPRLTASSRLPHAAKYTSRPAFPSVSLKTRRCSAKLLTRTPRRIAPSNNITHGIFGHIQYLSRCGSHGGQARDSTLALTLQSALANVTRPLPAAPVCSTARATRPCGDPAIPNAPHVPDLFIHTCGVVELSPTHLSPERTGAPSRGAQHTCYLEAPSRSHSHGDCHQKGGSFVGQRLLRRCLSCNVLGGWRTAFASVAAHPASHLSPLLKYFAALPTNAAALSLTPSTHSHLSAARPQSVACTRSNWGAEISLEPVDSRGNESPRTMHPASVDDVRPHSVEAQGHTVEQTVRFRTACLSCGPDNVRVLHVATPRHTAHAKGVGSLFTIKPYACSWREGLQMDDCRAHKYAHTAATTLR
ncbi:hypothetical protein TRVL_08866 [Trypanosoma vivax]|nr:hypothetical protein TRVL_08866 [Trypanosoma vivax]